MSGGKLLIIATIVALPVMSGKASAVWDCQAYSDFAIRDVSKAAAANCGFSGPRWSADPGLHFGFCTERLQAGDDNAMTSETNIRETEVFACEQRFRCTRYARTAIGVVAEANALNCGFQPPRWSTDEGLHFGFCMDRERAGDQFAISNETAIRATELGKCKAKVNVVAPPPPGPDRPNPRTVTVKLDVDLYDAPDGGRQVGMVPAGTVVELGECVGSMCKISGGGLDGWIYDGNDYDTLDR